MPVPGMTAVMLLHQEICPTNSPSRNASPWPTWCIPQEPENNRGVWEGVESAVRKLAKDRGYLYVVSGPIYQGDNILRIGGAVMVPTQLYKAVYDPARQEAGAYLVD